MVIVSFDLQKCLPTLHPTSGISFYKRKLWTLNLTLYEIRENKNSAICYLWNETIAKRGGQEIASLPGHTHMEVDMFYKFSFDGDQEFSSLDLSRKITRNLQNPQLTPISKKPLGIPENKLKHLQELQPYIDENSRVYSGVSYKPNSSDSEPDPFESDGDSEYNPDISHDIPIVAIVENSNVTLRPSNHVTPKRTRKRQRHVKEWKRMKAKKSRLSGETYETAKGKNRETIFHESYKLESYDLQSNFIASCLKKYPPTRKKIGATSSKQYVTNISLMNLRVCKQFFLNTLGITNRKFTTVCNKISKEGFVQTDQRGKHQPSNKIDEQRRNYVISHIQMFPRYRSHYSRSQNASTRYLSQDLNIKKLYALYCDSCTESNTCNTCDRLNNLIQNGGDNEVIQKSRTELSVYQKRVESMTISKQRDIEYCKESPLSRRVICFDLQKTLATPLLTTNKRQEVLKKSDLVAKVKEMMSEDFVSFEYLNDVIKDPKKDSDDVVLRWRSIVWFTYKQEEFLLFSFKLSRHWDFPFSKTEKCSCLPQGRQERENFIEREMKYALEDAGIDFRCTAFNRSNVTIDSILLGKPEETCIENGGGNVDFKEDSVSPNLQEKLGRKELKRKVIVENMETDLSEEINTIELNSRKNISSDTVEEEETSPYTEKLKQRVSKLDEFNSANIVINKSKKNDDDNSNINDDSFMHCSSVKKVTKSKEVDYSTEFEKFNNTATVSQLTTQLYGQKQPLNENVSVFITRKRCLFHRLCPDSPETILVNILLEQLNPQIRAHLRGQHFPSTEHLAQVATVIERDVKLYLIPNFKKNAVPPSASAVTHQADPPQNRTSQPPSNTITNQNNSQTKPRTPCKFCSEWHFHNHEQTKTLPQIRLHLILKTKINFLVPALKPAITRKTGGRADELLQLARPKFSRSRIVCNSTSFKSKFPTPPN
ncbi:hypothetical protein NQ314_015085 [Rhamnusium bicolor]|uniref:Uncharacterized protein n=1 Tax=Rhamnusium bicolor TaxID=1586634 RepID=A0AAV8WZJ4_9CUCU|nr:hypothetical protein NQ314_015085 [Rhamnusium bicolor]